MKKSILITVIIAVTMLTSCINKGSVHNVQGMITIGLEPVKDSGQTVHVYIADLSDDRDYTPNSGMNFKEKYLVCQVPVDGCIVRVLDENYNKLADHTIKDPKSYFDFTIDEEGNKSEHIIYKLNQNTTRGVAGVVVEVAYTSDSMDNAVESGEVIFDEEVPMSCR